MIINLPVWILALLAVIQFGQLMSNQQQIALSSRVGANKAANTTVLPVTDAAFSTSDIVTAVENSLVAAEIVDGTTPWCMELQHNDGGPFSLTARPNGGTCVCELTNNPPLPPVGRYVRVTVCVPFTAVAPNLLDSCGLDFSSNGVQFQSTYLHEG